MRRGSSKNCGNEEGSSRASGGPALLVSQITLLRDASQPKAALDERAELRVAEGAAALGN
jgi:hypothetical protein